MAISPVGFTPGLPSLPTLPTTAPVKPAGGDFGAQLAKGVEQLQQLHTTTDAKAVQAATGDLQDAHDYMIQSTQTALATELTVAVRNKAVEAFTEIMRMQV